MKRTGNPRVNPGTFSDLFESTAKASLRRGQMARSPRRLPPLEPEPSNSSTSTANLPQEPEQSVDQQNAEIPIPEETNFPNISTYENARAGFALQSDEPPPAEPLPPGPYGTSPQSILPKVQIPFITPPDVTPRSIEVERLKRLYQSMDIAQLLSDRGINYAQEIMFVPNESTFKPIFQLWSFDDDSFDCRTVENYLEIGKDENGKQAGIPCHVFTSNGLKWADAIAWEYNYDKHLWRVTFPNHEQDEEWVPRLRLLFYAEDPRVFADRIANAVNERRRAESWIRFRFYVENMSNKAMPDIPEDAVKAITKMIPSPRIKIELPIEKFMEEAQINYKYAFNVHSFMSQMKNDPLYARTLGLFDLSKEEEPKPKQYQTTSEFQKHREQFAFHSLYTKDCIFTALMKTRASCLDVANTELLVLRSNKSFHLEEFQQTQAQIISKTKRFLTEDWVPQLGRELRAALSNVSKGWFNLEETDREVYNMSKFSNFMVLVSCMMIDAARTCVLNNFQRFDDFIQDLSPNNVDVKTPTEVIGNYNKESTGAMIMPLFEIDMTIENNNEICYGIDPNLFRTACVQIFSSIVDSVRSIPIIEPRVLPDMFRNVNLTLSTINDDEKELVEHRERVVKRINEAIDYLQKYLDTYKQYIEFIQLDTNKYSEQLTNDQPTLDDCRNIIKEQQKAIDEIYVNVPKREIVGIFAVNVTTVRAYLIQKHHKLIKIILDYVSKTAKGLFKKFREEYRVIDSKITSPPTKIEELDAQRHYIETVPGLTEKLHARVMDAMRYYDFIDEYYHPISQDDFELKWECFGHSRHCAFLIEKSKAILEGFFIKFEQDLESAQEKFEGDLDKLSREVSEVSKYTDVNNSEQYATEIRRIAKAIEAAEANVKTFNSRQTIFGKEQTDYTRVSDLRRTFDPFSVLWLAVDQWIKLRNSIKEKPIIQLNAEQITKDLQTIYQSLHKSTKNFRNGPTSVLQIATELKQECNEMKDHIPLLTALLNPGMKQRHWQKLSEEIGFEFALDDEITLNDALELKLEDKIDVVSEVVGVASKEYSIETALQKMYSEWEEVVLDISPYKDTGTYVLKGSDDIIQKLDDDMVMTNTMEFSPYKKPFEERLNRWEATLKLITYVIEEWLECQRSWLALEPIFSSPDIRKQLPTESERFSTVDKTWRKILDNAYRTPQALKFCPSDKLLEDFKHNNKLLGHVQRGLNDYLESKRVAFPRFYFLSNDELLSILSQTKDPTAVQRHLRRCFENIGSLTFEKDLKMTEMNSCENEKVPFVRGIYPEGNVENWLLEVEADMRETLRDIMKKAVEQYPKVPRTEWVLNWPSQVVLAGAMIYWTKHVEEAIKRHAVKELLDALNVQMIELTKLVRVTTDFLNLRTLSCLIVLDVHAHDVVEKLVEVGVDSIDAFEWMSQLRYYWENDTVLIRMMTYEVEYGYEYLGNTSRLVITPLTDRCYLTLTSALQMNMGGAPQGPAGTGKTETTKDLAKAVAFQCVVYNCSETVDYLQMGVFLTGLASCGAWACFDEFNRIYVEVLSVIAQQITTIQNAIQANLKVFRFENRDVKLSPRCAVFITMNPGYAGRTELPDNLKALFRPVAMMVPDYRMIAEIKLYSFGFTEARPLSEKIVATFRLSSEQLSAQRHYDFGMRAVNTVIQTAGNLRRLQPDMPEALIVLRAIKDVNVPKFLVNDLVLFNDIISDLFPGVKERTLDYTALIDAIKTCAKKMKLQVNDLFITKIRQLHETFAVRWGVMLVGPTGAGKTQVFKTLAAACTLLNQTNQTFKKTHYHILNPKSITMGQLFGEFDMTTHEWTNGVLSEIIKQCSEDETPDNQWIVLDGPVDALWIENMNTVLDDNKKLCLSSSAVINFTDRMMMLFEVEDLAVASPATVSRCGMVFMQPNPDMKYLLESWVENQHPGLQKALMEILSPLYDKYLVPALKFVRERLKEPIKTTNSNLIQSLLRLFHALIQPFYSPDPVDPIKDDAMANITKWAPHFFWFAMIWSLGCTTDTDGRIMFDGFVRQQLRTTYIQFPSEGLVYDYKFNTANDTWENWMAGQPAYHISPGTSFNEIVVPTIDNVRHTFLIQTLLTAGYNFFCTGPTGTAKSVTINRYMMSSLSPETFMPIFISFSAQTNANQTQDIIDAKFERRLKGVYGPLDRKRAIIFFDDVNMPAKEVYGAQPPIELLRQWLDHGGWYDRKALEFHKLVDSQMICACGHPGGGRQHLTARFTRQFNLFNFPEMQDESLQMIFKTMLDSYLTIFDRSIQAVAISIADATISIYNTVRRTMLPIPSKSHYTFNLRDVSKVIQGVMSLHKAHIDTDRDIIAVWAHECTRVFADRLVDKLDLDAFSELLNKELQGRFKVSMDDLKKTKNLLYCDFFEETNEQKPYVQVTDEKKLETILNNAMADYDEIATKKLGLVLFPDAIEHVIRISRIIRQPSGHALLLGVGGSGRQSLTRLACHLSEYTIIQPEITKTYGTNEWLADIRTVMKSAGYEEKPTVFLVSDAQIVKESFLEDLNNLLNSGDVPNIFPPEDIEEIIEKIRPIAQQKDIQLSKPSIYNLFIQRVKSALHIVIALSPIGEAFRRRLRMFPSLVTCTSIDWFSDWSKDALFSVAQEFFADTFPNEKLQEVCSNFCVTAHTSVVEMSKELFQHEKRHNYVTPTSFLDFVQLVNRIQTEKMKEISKIKQSMETGLSALQVANSSVKDLQEKIIALQPTLDQLIKDADASKVEIAAEEEKTNEVRAKVEAETKVAEAKKAETQELKDAAEKDLAEIMPVLEKAQEGVKGLSSKAISTVRSYTNPPPAVRDVMKGVCILLRQHVITEPGKLPGEVVENWWGTSQKVLADPRFRNRLEKFTEEEKDNIPDSVIQKLLPLYKSENWSPEKAGACGEATLSLFNWVVAMGQYHDARKAVLPKEEALKQAQSQLDVAQKALDESLAKLKAAEDKIAKLRDDFQQVVSKKDDLLQQQEECKSKLSRAETLINNLSGEKGRWEATLNSVIEQEKNLTGDVLVAAAGVAYSGPFPSEYRARLLRTWIDFLSKNNITTSPGSSIIQTLQDPVEVLKWNLSGLPRDNMSLENTIIMSKSRRYSLCIDPQGQANRFIRNLNKDNQMEIVKLTDDNLVRSIENSIRFGRPLLIENVPEELDPILDPVLQNQVYKQSGADVIKIGDTVIPYNRGFRLYITTQLPNPHFSPELSAKVCLLDFTCTPSGLEEQLLALVVAKERPELEEMKNNLVIQNSKNQKKLLEIRAKMLDCLEKTEPSKLLDDIEIITTLTESNTMSQTIQQQVKEAEETERTIDTSRQTYRQVAFRGSLLFFCISTLFYVDPMYQYSLAWYISFFSLCIDQTPASDVLETRLSLLIDTSTKNFYNNICRSLFERHKRMFAFLLCYRIMQGANEIDSRELRFLIAGPIRQIEEGENPAPKWLTSKSWYEVKSLDTLPNFKGFRESFVQDIDIWKSIFDSPDASRCKFPGEWEVKLTLFQRLLVLRVLRPDSMGNAIQDLIQKRLGDAFLESPQFDISSSFDDSTVTAPLIFVLSVGADPASDLVKFAEKKNFSKKLSSMSLGQGQGEYAEQRLTEAMDRGHWLLLQNCHLAVSWLPRLEILIEKIKPEEVNRDFRLWLTSMPSADFPVSILQRGIKMTNEPPKGIKQNLLRSMMQYDDKTLNDCAKPFEYHKLIYSLCFFHALTLERRKYGPLGFNQIYDWTTGDLEISQKQLKMFLDLYDQVPYKVLTYLTGEINYGGRVTDDWDRRTLLSILDDFYNPDVISDTYKFTENPRYTSLPEQSHKMYIASIREYPINDSPDIFGLHANAEVSYQQSETFTMFNNLLLLQARTGGGGSGQTREEVINGLATDLLREVPDVFDMPAIQQKYPIKYEDSMNTVLVQQCEMYNKLITICKTSLRDIINALKGIVVMSGELEAMGDSMFDNHVPTMWSDQGYPSTKPLSGWMQDLKKRVKFLQDWVERGPPTVFWISGFFMQQAFLTGIKQNCARKNQIGVDTISFGFEVMDTENPPPRKDEGVYITGLFIEGASWDPVKKVLADPRPKELFQAMPPIVLKPIGNRKKPTTGIYECPVYKVGTRKGTLSTTGHSTNYVLTIELPSDKPQSFWIKRGVAMICSLSY
ncbi:Dynein heavy chain family protein [Trichomonas vaginalis G3]|uniref:Dynein-1, subspecies f n=1 Tax=Trichomonas vaginalis (strain ATCC PRA-98 / G3) TaxID=412133 RepID=A2DIT0_TRIV3|nr:dynein light chain binding [Trichomonas vaginalis G3]EAY19693.1 Dynein heavy chain family protein [Trichomonas vaginalis G3]KAI5521287.1 dynein light chain binding [Trichomonas vaginalis G3]|eukprot:XP_001580679.1 Dynein heavy chain family protein [Trichomonas vaginalis G3]